MNNLVFITSMAQLGLTAYPVLSLIGILTIALRFTSLIVTHVYHKL